MGFHLLYIVEINILVMERYKIISPEENKTFVDTKSYQELLFAFQYLREDKGKIIHVVGAPGTGKSTNIYAALEELGINFYEARLALPNTNLSSKEVFETMIQSMRENLGLQSQDSVFKALQKYDVILFADKFHDSHFFHKQRAGFSQWTDYKGISSSNFYYLCIINYLKHRKEFKDINMVLQTAWRVHLRGSKMDIFTDFGPLSRIAVSLLKIPFTVVEIAYSHEEVINIVKGHLDNVDDDTIRDYIEIYGPNPRFICQALENHY